MGKNNRRLALSLIAFGMVDLRAKRYFLAFVFFASSCNEADRSETLLEIDREYMAPRLKWEARWADSFEPLIRERADVKRDDELHEVAIPMAPALAMQMLEFFGESESDSEPFTKPADDRRVAKVRDVQEVLERAGITFAEGASASYDPEEGVLTVVNTEEQIELVQRYLAPVEGCSVVSIHVRAEIYELHQTHGLQLLESAAHESDHTPERNAAKKAVEQGMGRLVAAPSVNGQSGLRSSLEYQTRELSALSRTNSKPGGLDLDKVVPTTFGTVFEVDASVGGDDFTLDLDFRLTHETDPWEQPLNGDNPPESEFVSRPKSITTQVTLNDGAFLLVGTWNGDNNTMQVIFLTAAIQHHSDIRPMVKKNSSRESANPK